MPRYISPGLKGRSQAITSSLPRSALLSSSEQNFIDAQKNKNKKLYLKLKIKIISATQPKYPIVLSVVCVKIYQNVSNEICEIYPNALK
jgi:hypothetical protein